MPERKRSGWERGDREERVDGTNPKVETGVSKSKHVESLP